MGNNTSNKPGGAEVAVGAYSPTSRDGNVYDQSFIPPPAGASRSYSTPATQTTSSYSTVSPPRVSPPLPPRGLDRRAHTMIIRDRDSPVRRCIGL